eukprot:219876_1
MCGWIFVYVALTITIYMHIDNIKYIEASSIKEMKKGCPIANDKQCQTTRGYAPLIKTADTICNETHHYSADWKTYLSPIPRDNYYDCEAYRKSNAKCWVNCSEWKYSITNPDDILFEMMCIWIGEIIIGYLFIRLCGKGCCMDCNIATQSIIGTCVFISAVYTSIVWN